MKKYLVAFCLLIFPFLFGTILMSIPRFWNFSGSSDGWLGYWGGVIGAFFGVIGAYFVMNEQLKKEEERRKKDDDPIIVPGSSKKMSLSLYPGMSISEKPQYFKDIKHFTDLHFQLINGGKTPIYDLEYYYEFANEDRLAQSFYKGKNLKNTFPQIWFEKENKYPEQKNLLIYIYKDIDQAGNSSVHSVREEVVGYTNFESVLMPGDTIPIYIDKKTNMLLSFVFQSIRWLLEDDIYEWPIIKINIRYKDYELKQRVLSFNLKIDEYSVKDNHLEIRIKADIKSIKGKIF